MRICIFGNTNNYPFLLAQGLRHLGVEVRLLLNRKELLHRPESKDARWSNRLPGWVTDVSDVPEERLIAGEHALLEDFTRTFGRFDALVLNHLGPSLAYGTAKPSIALLTGSDLLYYADYATNLVRQSSWSEEMRRSPQGQQASAEWRRFVDRQRAGIAAATAVSFPRRGLVPPADRMLDEIGIPDSRRFFVFLADTDSITHAKPPDNPDLRIFNGARIMWVKPLPGGFTSQDDKGTDILIRGFAEYLRHGGKGQLRLVEKGLDIDPSKALIRDLGIESHCLWLPELPLHQFNEEMRLADVVCDQLGESFPAMVANDAMAMGRPVIGRFRLEIMARHYSDPMPVCHAVDSQSVADHLLRLARSGSLRASLGAQGRQFAERWLSPEANARACIERLGVPCRKRSFFGSLFQAEG